MKRIALHLALISFASIPCASSAQKDSTYMPRTPTFGVLKKISIEGDGGWDYLSIDSASHRLFISRGTHMQVLDVETGKLVGDIPNTPGVHGAAIAAKLNKGFTSNGGDDSVTVFDLRTLKETSRIKVGNRPDAITYDPASNRVFTFNAGSQDATAIDATTNAVVGSVKLSGKPEFPQPDGKGMMFVNIEDMSAVERFDTKTLKSLGSWPSAPGQEASGLAIDVRDHVVFSTCSNNILAITDTKTGKVVGSPKIGNGPDAADFDPALALAFSSNGQDGTLTIVGRNADGKWDVVQTVETQTSARTMALDPKTHRVYLIAHKGNRRQPVPGSTVIIVVGPK